MDALAIYYGSRLLAQTGRKRPVRTIYWRAEYLRGEQIDIKAGRYTDMKTLKGALRRTRRAHPDAYSCAVAFTEESL